MARVYDPTPVVCECGATVTAGGMAQHRQTTKHLSAQGLKTGAPFSDSGSSAASRSADEPDTSAEREPRSSGPAKVTAIGGKGQARQALLDEAAELTCWIQQGIITSVAPAAPVVAEYWSQAEPDTTEAWTVICRKHPKALAATLASADYLAYGVLGKFVAGLGVAVGVETGFLAADNGLAMATGVTQAWEKVMAERDELGMEVAENYRAGESSADSADRWVGPLAGLG